MTWNTLRHPNVLPLLGVSMGDYQLAMVSEWMDHGNINEFVKTHWDANRFELVRPYFYHLAQLPPITPLIAQGRCYGINVYAWAGNDTRGSEGGMILGLPYPASN